MNNLGALPLGIDFIEILLHLFNFVILLVGMRLLLYKPIKKFMTQRENQYRSAEEDKKAALNQAKKTHEEAERVVKQARQKAVAIAKEASAAAEVQKDEIISHANKQAKEVLQKAKSDIQKEKEATRKELMYSISELAVEIASRILEREVQAEDNDIVIKTLIEEWKEEDA